MESGITKQWDLDKRKQRERKIKVIASTSKPMIFLETASGEWIELTVDETKELASDLWFKAEAVERHIERLIEDDRFYKDIKEGKIKKP